MATAACGGDDQNAAARQTHEAMPFEPSEAGIVARVDAGQVAGPDSDLISVPDAALDATAPQPSGAELEAINAWILGSALPANPAQSRVEGAPLASQAGSNCISTTHVSAAGSTTNYVVFNPNEGVLFPGSLVQSATASTGILDPVSAPRAAIDVVLSGAALRISGEPLPSSVFKLEPAAYSKYETARRALVGEGFVPQGAWDYHEVTYYSFDQAMMELNISGDWLGGEAAAKLNLSNSTARTKLLVEFKQRFYTTSIDAPQKPSDVFAPDAVLSALRNQSDPVTNPIAYVANVTYGVMRSRAVLPLPSSNG